MQFLYSVILSVGSIIILFCNGFSVKAKCSLQSQVLKDFVSSRVLGSLSSWVLQGSLVLQGSASAKVLGLSISEVLCPTGSQIVKVCASFRVLGPQVSGSSRVLGPPESCVLVFWYAVMLDSYVKNQYIDVNNISFYLTWAVIYL